MKKELELDLMKKFKELNIAKYTTKYGYYYGLMFAGAEIATKELQEENADQTLKIDRLESACDAYNYSQRTYQEEIKELKAQIEKTKWHDLRIDPNDLPKKNKSYWVYIDCQGNKIYRSIVWQGCWLGWNCIPLAWCEEPQFN